MDTKTIVELDLRPLECSQRHGLIFQTWATLKKGESFVITNDHDPLPVRMQFERQFGGAHYWEYLEEGNGVFKIRICRVEETDDLKPIRMCGTERSVADAPAASGQELDLRDLEPPQPMVAVLEALEGLEKGQSLTALLDRRPIHLFPELEARKAGYRCEERSDGAWVLVVLKQV